MTGSLPSTPGRFSGLVTWSGVLAEAWPAGAPIDARRAQSSWLRSVLRVMTEAWTASSTVSARRRRRRRVSTFTRLPSEG
jgi:hypothetical protein